MSALGFLESKEAEHYYISWPHHQTSTWDQHWFSTVLDARDLDNLW